MKRRRFFQYTGLGGLSLLLTARSSAIASALTNAIKSDRPSLETFSFRVTTVDGKGRLQPPQTHTARYFSEPLKSVERLQMVELSAGNFWMGSPQAEVQAKGREFSRHRVKLSSFFLSKYLITQAQ